MESLEPPIEVINSGDADEILRLWIVEGDSIVTLRNLFGQTAHNWGMILADIAVHVGRMRLEQDNIPEVETLKAIEDGYRGRMAEFHNISYRSLGGRN